MTRFHLIFPAIHVTSIPWRAKTTPPITESGKIHTDTYRRLTELLPVKLASARVTQGTIMWMVVPLLSSLQGLGGVPGSQPMLPSGMDPTRQQGLPSHNQTFVQTKLAITAMLCIKLISYDQLPTS